MAFSALYSLVVSCSGLKAESGWFWAIAAVALGGTAAPFPVTLEEPPPVYVFALNVPYFPPPQEGSVFVPSADAPPVKAISPFATSAAGVLLKRPLNDPRTAVVIDFARNAATFGTQPVEVTVNWPATAPGATVRVKPPLPTDTNVAA